LPVSARPKPEDTHSHCLDTHPLTAIETARKSGRPGHA
jgi:hypothetical protein